jgi:hypothetical protein
MQFLLLFVVPAAGLFGVMAVPIYFVRRYLKLRERQVAALEGAQSEGQERLLLEENRSLRERIEKLESIVSSSDYELNRKLAALDDAPAGPPGGAREPRG